MNDLLHTRHLSVYKSKLVERTTTGSAYSDAEFDGLMRCFVWFSHPFSFQEVYEIAEIAMPVLAGYVGYLYQTDMPTEEYERKVEKVVELVNMLGAYLDAGMLMTTYDYEEPTTIVDAVCCALQAEFKLVHHSMIPFADVAIKTQEHLLQSSAGEPSFQILHWSDSRKIERLQELFMELALCKNLVYHVIRREGKQLLHNLTDWLYQLHPADQAYILRGLDGFPKNRQVMALYTDFIQNSESDYAVQEVEKYLDKVARGIHSSK